MDSYSECEVCQGFVPDGKRFCEKHRIGMATPSGVTGTNTYAVFYIKGAEDFASWRFFGLWRGETPEEAIEASNISKGHGDATGVATLPWADARMFARTGWEAQE